jgi:hypothetical protein
MRKRTTINILPAGQVVVCPGTDREETYIVPAPVGRFGSDLAFALMRAISDFQTVQEAMQDTNSQAEATGKLLDALDKLVGTDNWWNKLMPAAFGVIGDVEETKHLQNDYAIMELFTPFMEAAGLIADRAFGGKESSAALKKSSDGEEAVPKAE